MLGQVMLREFTWQQLVNIEMKIVKISQNSKKELWKFDLLLLG